MYQGFSQYHNNNFAHKKKHLMKKNLLPFSLHQFNNRTQQHPRAVVSSTVKRQMDNRKDAYRIPKDIYPLSQENNKIQNHSFSFSKISFTQSTGSKCLQKGYNCVTERVFFWASFNCEFDSFSKNDSLSQMRFHLVFQLGG